MPSMEVSTPPAVRIKPNLPNPPGPESSTFFQRAATTAHVRISTGMVQIAALLGQDFLEGIPKSLRYHRRWQCQVLERAMRRSSLLDSATTRDSANT